MTRHPPAVETMVADAAALANVIAHEDFPNGFVVISAPLPGRFYGCAVGPGVALAQAHGFRGGQGGVWADPEKHTLGVARPTAAMAATYTAVVLHELAHAVTDAIDAPDAPTAMGAVEHTATQIEFTAEVAARWHCHRWAAACVLLLNRATPFRRAAAGVIRARMAADLLRYGMDLDAAAKAVADLPTEGALRPMLAKGGEWDAVLAERFPALDTRLAAIELAGTPRLSGERGLA